MLEIKIPADIREYKGKVIAGLTVRQLISLIAAVVVGVLIGVFSGRILPEDIVMWCVILSVAPILAWGFVKYKDMRFEELAAAVFKLYFLPQRRVYEDTEENYLLYVKTVLAAKEIRRQRIEIGDILDDGDSEKEEDDYAF